MKRIDPDDLDPEEEFELRAAFGDEAVDNGEIVDLTDDLLRTAEREDEYRRRWDGDTVVDPEEY